MRELVLPIAANVVLGMLLLVLLYWKRTGDKVRLSGADDAVNIFRIHFPDAIGAATVAADGRGALIDLQQGAGIGLLHRQGRRWNARVLAPGAVSSVRTGGAEVIDLRFVDFAWPRARIRIAGAEARTAWLGRLESLAAQGSSRHRPDLHHA